MKRYILLILLFTLTNSLIGNDNFRFYTINVNADLPQATILNIFQDSKCFIWFCTYDGLCRYDGKKLNIYSTNENDSKSLSNSTVNDIVEGFDNKLYFATRGGGLNVYDRNTELFEYYYSDSSETSIVDNLVYGLLCASDSTIWMATYGGVSRFLPETKTFRSYHSTVEWKHGYPDASSFCVHEDSDNTIWIGAYQEGILQYSEETDSFEQYLNDVIGTYDSESNTISQIENYNDTTLVLATKAGVYFFNTITKKFSWVVKNTSVFGSILVDSDKNIWMFPAESDAIIRKQTGEIIMLEHDEKNPYSISRNINVAYEDKSGLIWIGTVSHGMQIFNPATQQFKNIFKNNSANSIVGNAIYGLAEDEEDNLWIGTINGISIYNKTSENFKNLVEDGTTKTPNSNLIWHLLYDTDGYMWMATSNGVNRYSFETGLFEYHKPKINDSTSIADTEVFCIEKDKNGDIWAGTYNGLSRYNLKTKTWKSYYSRKNDTNTLSNSIIWHILADSKGDLWIATNRGLNQYNFSSDKFIRHSVSDTIGDLLANTDINLIYEDQENTDILWLSTQNGLVRYDRNKINLKIFNKEDGLPNNTVYGIEETSGYLWFTTNLGLSRFNKNTFEIVNFDKKDGIQGNEFNLPSLKLSDGRFAFGGMNGLTIFYPDSINIPTSEIKIYFTNIMLNGKPLLPMQERYGRVCLKQSILSADTIELSYKEKLISLNFTALLYFQNEKINYRYRVLPKANNWIELKGINNVTFTNLPPGKYTLEIQSTNEQNKWLNNTKSLLIIIHPPFYKQVWFYILVALIALYFIRHRIQRFKTANNKLELAVQERTEKISAQKEELEIQRDRIAEHKAKIEHFAEELEIKVELKTKQYKEAKEKAEESDRLKSAFLANMSHEIRTPMNAIIGFSDLLASIDVSDEERKNYANYIKNNGDALLNLLNDILDASIIEAGKLQLVNKEFGIIDVLENTHMSFIHSELLKNKLNVVLDIQPCKYASVKLNTDLFRLCQVLNNLVGNALKYTNSGSVSVIVIVEDSKAIFEVKDTGVGIKRSELSRIFERFHKDENGGKTPYRGGGLGLPISKSLVELMGGEIWVESELNVGSTFYFSIPRVI